MTARRPWWVKEKEREEKAIKVGKPRPILQRAIRAGEKAAAKRKKEDEEAAAIWAAESDANASPPGELIPDPDPKPDP